jgi:hypothetical protein
VNDINAAHWPTNVAREKMLEVGIAKERTDLRSNVVSDLWLYLGDVLEEFLSPVDKRENILRVPAGDQIVVAAPAIGLQLGRNEEGRCEAPDHEPLLQLRLDRGLYTLGVSAIAESEDLLVIRHEIDLESAQFHATNDIVIGGLGEASRAKLIRQCCPFCKARESTIRSTSSVARIPSSVIGSVM